MTYAWISGSRVTGDADAIGHALERVRRAGRLTPFAVVRAAREKRSPLHAVIYDGTTADEALHIYHLERAKLVLRSIAIAEGDTETIQVRGFQVIEIDGDREYVMSSEAKDDAEFRAQVRARLIRDLAGIKRRLAAWDEFAAVMSAIDDAIAA